MGTKVAEAAHKLTYEDYCRIPDDGKRREVIDGVAYVSPSPTLFHQRVIVRFLFLLGNFLARTGIGEVLVAPLDVRLGEHDIVQPDLLVVLRGG